MHKMKTACSLHAFNLAHAVLNRATFSRISKGANLFRLHDSSPTSRKTKSSLKDVPPFPSFELQNPKLTFNVVSFSFGFLHNYIVSPNYLGAELAREKQKQNKIKLAPQFGHFAK